jgi:hypothetical protein
MPFHLQSSSAKNDAVERQKGCNPENCGWLQMIFLIGKASKGG